MSFEIAIISESVLSSVRVVPMENKPLLAVAMEKPRISQYPEPQRNTTTLSFVEWALNMLGVNHKEGGTGHHTAVFEFVNTSLQGYTYEELKQAILMFVRGEFNGSDIFVSQQLNPIVLGKIMQAFDLRKKESLNAYLRLRSKQIAEEERKKNELTDEEKEELTIQGICRCYNYYQSKKDIITGYVWIYDYLQDNGTIKDSKEDKLEAMAKCKEKALNKPKPLNMSKEVYRQYKSDVEKNKNGEVIVAAKSLLLKYYFDVLLVKYGENALHELLKSLGFNVKKTK